MTTNKERGLIKNLRSVRSEGRRGGQRIAPFFRRTENATGGGSKIPKNLRTYLGAIHLLRSHRGGRGGDQKLLNFAN